jgi:NAD(P)-dependent dehydrogenase (short-subunit alcohol dehydrogenase family)
MRGKTVVITGGTSGIGEVAAVALAKMGARIVLGNAAIIALTILPVSSTMQTLVSLTDTSNPAKWSMLRFSF